jgi:phosphate-selective porin OprO/OprP
MRSEARGQNNIYRAQIGGDTLTSTRDYGTSANNAITINQKLRGIEFAGAKGPFKFQMETFNSKYNASGTVQNLAAPATTEFSEMGVQVKADYMELMYNITGESWADAYKGGAFGGIKPKTNFMTDYGGQVGMGTGAWQIGFRTSKYSSSVDNIATCTGAAETKCETAITGTNSFTSSTTGDPYSRVQNAETARTNTYALNWILNSNARVMFNYAETKYGQSIILLDVNSSTAGTNTLSSGATDKERVFSVRTQINF